MIHLIKTVEDFRALQDYIKTKDTTGYKHRIEKLIYKFSVDEVDEFHIPTYRGYWDESIGNEIKEWLKGFHDHLKLDQLIFGKCPFQRVVSCEVEGNDILLYIEHPDRVEVKRFPNTYWMVSSFPLDKESKRLEGDLFYKYIKHYPHPFKFYADKKKWKGKPVYSVGDPKEAAMLIQGFTYYKGMKAGDVSVLAFDIESTGLEHNASSKVLLISNTFRKNGKIERQLFCYDDYENEKEMFDAWSEWVQEINPAILVGHNIFMYDLPYMAFCAEKAKTELKLGRNGSAIKFMDYNSKFRFDGSQDYDFKKAFIYAREIVDTMFLSMKYDFGRKYENYKLKQIIKQEKLEVRDRQFYEAGLISENYQDPEEWIKIKRYAIHDADDSLALFDLMIPSYFYYSQSIPKPFQSVMYSASGSQINSFLVRSYLQDCHSLPEASPDEPFEGAISFGNPGVYHNVFKVDVASLYPSIMIQYEVYDPVKDPKQNFLKMVTYFTKQRLEDKKKAKETGDRYYKDLEQSRKITINSAFGMMGAPGLLFNSPKNAGFVTLKGREILQQAIDWATAHQFQIVNADTDSISIVKNNEPLTEDDRKLILQQINALYPSKIHFEDDGYYQDVLVIKTKNYVLKEFNNKVKIKGSALKATTKETALKEFINNTIHLLLKEDKEGVIQEYHRFVKEIFTLTDISRWTSRKTVTEKVLQPKRTNERKVFDALQDEDFQMGDKVYVYFTKEKALKLQEHWDNDHDPDTLLKKLYSTIKVFSNVIDVKLFPNYTLKKNKALLLQELSK